MRARERIRVLRRGRSEAQGESLSRADIESRQHAALSGLVRHAAASSRFHRDRLPAVGAQAFELESLPVMHKDDLVASFDAVVTDPRLTLPAVEEHVAGMQGPDPLLFGEYRVLTTGGTSGVTTYIPFDRSSWLSVLSPYVRFATTLGFAPRLFPRRRIAQITAGGPLHMTNRIAASNDSPAYATLRLDVTAPTASLVAALEQFQPDVLTGYPSVIAALAEEQRAGRLGIAPGWIFCGSEQLLPSARRAIREAWAEPYDVYATTETGGVLAFECERHDGLHIREETCIVEAVDADDRPVRDDEPAAGLLVTSWLNRTVPLIRYRLEDPVTVTSVPCACGRATRRILALDGRREDMVILPGVHGGSMPVHPNHFEEAVEERPEVARYQVRQRRSGLTVSIVPRHGGGAEWTDELAVALDTRLRALGAEPPEIRIELVDELERPASAGAKLKVVQSELSYEAS